MSNRLINEKSPYLRQHAENPVDWYPWGEEAFEKARREDKPVFLSIGYSTCHWCHVMAHESFEDPGIAAILNEHDVLSPEELAGAIAESLANREQLLKLLSMNNYDMEANSRLERLTSFKRAYGKSIQLLRELLKKFCPETTDAEIQNIVYVFLPFMFGVYPYAAVTEKQKAAMKEAGVEFVNRSIYDITYDCLIRLLRSRQRSEKEMK